MNEAILQKIIEDKQNGLSDKNIGDKYGVNLKFIEKTITEKIGINITNPVINQTHIRTLCPKNFKSERNTIWSFKSRGNWATHNGNYRGNWSPYIPRNIILRYSNESDLVLDYFCGAGSTAVECKLLNRNFLGIDINPKAIELAELNLDFNIDSNSLFKTNIQLEYGDARNLNINNNAIDLICAHPPYADILHYTHENPNDLSNLKIEEFLSAMDKVAKESYRVLKDNKYCVILMGDMRKNKNVIPLGFWVIEKFLNNGFQIQELIIKRQHNCKTTGFWYKNSIRYNFLLLAHEYLIVFKKQKNRNNNYFNVNETFSTNKALKEIGQVIKKDIDLESKTVWIFNKKNWAENAISNLILRYADKNYLIYNDSSNCFDTAKNKRFNLIILQNENEILKNLNIFNDSLSENGILAIICEDIRLENGLIYSPAIEIEKFLRNIDIFKIKEIILIALEDNISFKEEKFLEINHKYILIYKKN